LNKGKTYKFRLYQSDKQQEKLNSFLGTKRFIYNHYLNEKEKNNKFIFYSSSQICSNCKTKNKEIKDLSIR